MKKYCYFLLLLLLGSVTGAYSQSKTISGGNDHGLIICAQGYLYTWGNNYSTTIGGPLLGIDPDVSGNTPTATYVYSPQRVKTGNLTFGMVTSGSGAFNLALSCHKVVYAWGSNDTKACGQDATSGPVVQYPVPVLKGETPGYDEQGNPGGDYLGGVVYLAASTNSGFAIMDDGRVVGWGQGQWNPNTGAAAGLPAYIKDKNGNDLQNITHISGGDDNCLLRDANGNLYGIGPWNGNVQTTVTYAVPVLKADDGTPLTDIRMSAAGDVCGFAVTGDGYVWSWGNGGWGGSTGVSQSGLTHYNAMKVSSGEYQTISNEEYLTDVKEVIGGRGHGAAVTKEGYLVYWGCNDDNGGVVPTDAATALTYASGAQGVKPILAKYCDASGKPSKVVTDAVSISRGDNFDFMVNDKDEYYVWGLNDLGQTGTGVTTVAKYNCLIKLETIPCEIQDACPQVFMIDRVKCPGEEIELDCGFVVPIGKEKRYYIEWYYNGTKLNTSTIKKGVAGNWVYDSSYDSDPYNKASILITDPGMYKVIAYYVGVNIPCDACEPDETEIEVTDMPMPIDTTITNMNCVALPLSPSQSDNICFKATTNNKFYKATDNVKFAVFSTKDKTDGDTIDIIETTGAGGVISFCLSGDKIKDIEDNKAKANPDTIYNIWLEDISKFETYLREGAPGAAAQGGSFQSYGMLLDMYASADLESFDVYCKSYSGTSSISITPTIYKAEKNVNGIYVVGSVFWQGDAQTFSIDASGPNKCTVKCDARVPGSSARGVRYILGMSLTGNCTTYEYTVGLSKQNSPEYVTPLADSENFGIYEMGQTANSYTTMSNGGTKSCYYNVKFGKLTDYDCGRIQLSARYGCPPCNKPDVKASGKYVEIEPSQAAVDDTVRLCKESAALVLEVNDVKNTVEPTAKFDILWFDNYADLGVEANAIKSETATTSSITVNWADVTPGETKTYYVKVRDNEKTDASACYVYDSIKVKADTVPVVPEITVDPFCEGSLSSADLAAIEAKFTFAGYNADIQNEAGASLTLAALVSEISSLTAGTYKYTVTLTDAVTGCVSEPKSTSFEVWANPSETLDATTPFCEGVATT
ncbi:MAG TPA: hypothetical protein PKZ15_01595, partial [Paludibacteraceae bacterium]|nr:hypothetical protein [Paludibacteraceae bacterium]